MYFRPFQTLIPALAMSSLAALTVLAASGAQAHDAGPEMLAAANAVDDPIALAESAGPPEIAQNATIMDADGNILREGTNTWTCVAMPGQPMCLDEQWMSWLDAYLNQRDEVEVTALGISYMLQGDQGASNIDPYAEEPTADNDWVVTGPHLMLIVPDSALLDDIPSDPESGGPYVMWRGTPLEHVMVPIYEDSIEMPQR